MEEDLTLSEPVVFEFGKQVYVYDFTKLTIEQVEYASELFRFKKQTMENPPESFQTMVKSKAIDYLPMMMSFLLRKRIDNETQPFSYEKAELEVQPLIKNAPIDKMGEMKRCITDFFTKSGIGEPGLMTISNKLKLENSFLKTILPVLMNQMMNTNSSKEAI